jgi:hypothetical protein
VNDNLYVAGGIVLYLFDFDFAFVCVPHDQLRESCTTLEVKDIDFGKYDFGKVRTVEDYERYSGLSFKKRAIQQFTLDLKSPPNPKIDDPVEYENSFLKIFKHCIDVYYSQLNHDDYDFWVVSFEMKDGTVIHRRDADENEIAHMKHDKEYMKIWREFNTDVRPEKWVVWMHSKSAGWVDRYEGCLV